MTIHYFNIHNKTKFKEEREMKTKEINQKFEQWAGNRIGHKYSKDNKDIINNKSNNNNIIRINNKSEIKENKNNIDEEEEEIKINYLEKVDKILEKKNLKIKEKMKEISMNKKEILKKLLKKEQKEGILKDNNNNYLDISKIVKEIREKEKK